MKSWIRRKMQKVLLSIIQVR